MNQSKEYSSGLVNLAGIFTQTAGKNIKDNMLSKNHQTRIHHERTKTEQSSKLNMDPLTLQNTSAEVISLRDFHFNITNQKCLRESQD